MIKIDDEDRRGNAQIALNVSLPSSFGSLPPTRRCPRVVSSMSAPPGERLMPRFRTSTRIAALRERAQLLCTTRRTAQAAQAAGREKLVRLCAAGVIGMSFNPTSLPSRERNHLFDE